MLANPSTEVVKLSRSTSKTPAWVCEVTQPMEEGGLTNFPPKSVHANNAAYKLLFKFEGEWKDQQAEQKASESFPDLKAQVGTFKSVSAPEVSWPMYEDEKLYIWLEAEAGLVLIRVNAKYRPTANWIYTALQNAIKTSLQTNETAPT